MEVSSVLQDYANTVDGAKLLTLVIFVIANFVLGVLIALRNGTFTMNKIAEYLQVRVLFLVGGYFVVGLVALVDESYKPIVVAAFTTLVLFYSSRVYSQFQEMSSWLGTKLPTLSVSGRVLLGQDAEEEIPVV